ncbi:phosphotransferase [Streptomyces acidicola]|uniref:phosphotransferase n=1 Tax=Streptomyces acidicola TaxID=2596892 RepID=UPI0037F86402
MTGTICAWRSATWHAPDRTAAASKLPGRTAGGASRLTKTGVDQGVPLHGDLMPKHVWDDQGRLVGLIDWGDAMAGDDAFRQFLKGYGRGQVVLPRADGGGAAPPPPSSPSSPSSSSPSLRSLHASRPASQVSSAA